MYHAAVSSDPLVRLLNGIRKIFAGLRPFSESVWPGVNNDLFVAHRSIYAFAAHFCAGKQVLDAGCGTGYGAFALARNGAATLLAVDRDRLNISFARRHFALPNLTFQQADLERIVLPASSLDVIVSSNVIEHLDHPAEFLGRVRQALAPGGVGIVAVPPVRNAYERGLHAGIHYHRSVYSVDDWITLFESAGFRHRPFLHQARRAPDFTSHRRSELTLGDFFFEETDDEGLRTKPTITAVFVLSKLDPRTG